MRNAGPIIVLVACLALATTGRVHAQFKLVDVTDSKDVTAAGSQVTFASTLAKPGVTKSFRLTNTSKTTQTFFPYFSPDSGFSWAPSSGGSDSIFDDGFGREFNTSLPRDQSGGFIGTVSTPASLTAGASMSFTLTWMPSRNPMQGVGTFVIISFTSTSGQVIVELTGTAPPLAGADPVVDQLLYTFEKPAGVYDYSNLEANPIFWAEPSAAPGYTPNNPWFVSSALTPDRPFLNGTRLCPAGVGTGVTSLHVLNDPPPTIFKQRLRFNDGMFLPTDSLKLPGRDNVGLELWFRAEPAALSGERLLAGMGQVLQDGFGLVIDNGTVKARAGAGSWLAGPQISALEWHHAAVLLQAGVATLFVDGVAYGRRTRVQLPAAVVGLRVGGTAEMKTLLGEVDRLRVFVVPKGFVAPRHLLVSAAPIAMAIPQTPYSGPPMKVIDFGPTATRSHSLNSVPVRNLMPKAMNVTGLAIAGNASFSVQVTPPIQIAVTTTMQIPVQFSPGNAGVVTADLVVNTDDPLYPTIRVPLLGTGKAVTKNVVTKNVVIEPASGVLDFGATASINNTWGPSRRIVFTEAYAGAQDSTRFFNFTLGGPNPEDFQLPAMTSVEVSAGGSANYDVTFVPHATGVRTATLRFETSDPVAPVVTMQLTGSSAGSLNSLGVSDAGDTPIALTPMGRTLTLAVTAPFYGAVWQALAIGGPQASEFSVRRILSTKPSLAQAADPGMTLPFTMQPGQTVYLELACVPAETGDGKATLHFTTDAITGGEFDYQVTAHVTPQPVLLDRGILVQAGGVQFPALPMGNSLTHTLTVTNIGFAPATSLNVAFTDTTGAFTLSGLQTTTLAPGASTQMTLSFAPAAATSYSAQITISSDNVTSTSYPVLGSGSATPLPAQRLRSGWQTDLVVLTTRYAYIAGSDLISGSGGRSYRIRRLSNGADNLTFGKSLPNGPVKAMVIQADGTLYIAGSFTRVGEEPRQGIARLRADGSLDESFVPPAGDFRGRAVGVWTDNRVLVGGAGSLGRKNLILLLPDGSLDTSFNLAEPNGPVNVIAAAQPGYSGLVVGGAFDNPLGASTNYWTPSGTLVTVNHYGSGWTATGMLSTPPTGSRLEVTDVAGNFVCGYLRTTDAGGVARTEKRFGHTTTWPQPYTITVLVNGQTSNNSAAVVAEPGTLVIKGNDVYFAVADESSWPPRGTGSARAAVMKVNTGTQLIGSVDGAVHSIAVTSANTLLVGGDFSHVGSYCPIGNAYSMPLSPPAPATTTPADGLATFTTGGITSTLASTPVAPVVLPAPTLQIQDAAELDPLAEGSSIDFGAPTAASTRQFTVINTSETTSTGPVHIQLRSGGNSVFALNAPDGVILQPGEMLSFSLTCRPRWQGNATASIQISEGSGTTRPVMFNVWATVGDNLAVLPSAGIGQIGTTVKLAFLRDGYSPYYSATYQWLHDGTPVPGATAASFSLKIASLADAGAYTCRVKGSTGLTLDTAPVAIVVTSGGIRLDKLSNGLATLDLLFAGKPDSIQWMKNDVAAGNDATVKLAVKPDDVIKCVLTLGTATATYTTSQIALTPAPVVLPATFAWTTASDVSAQLATSGAPLQFSITGLPAGVTYDTRTGVLTGRPRLPGRYTLRAAASNAAGLGPVRAIVATVTGTPQIVSANLCGSWAARLGRDDAVTSGTGGQVYFSVLANGAMTGTLTTGQAFPETRTSVVPSSAEHWANGALLTRFIGAFHASASGPFVADVPFRLSLPVRGAMMVLHLELASTGTITGALRYRDAGALIDLGGLVNRNTSATISRIAVTMLPALSDVPVAVTCGPYSMWVESFADQSKRFASTVALADGQLLLFRPALEYDGSGNKTGVSTLSAAMRLSPSQQQLQGSATSGNSLREVITHVISGVVTH